MTDRPLGHIDAERFKATLSPEAYAGLMEATSQSARDAGQFVVLGQQESEPEPRVIEAFAKGLELDAFTARLRLIAPTPRILRREETRERADRWVSWLHALGLKGYRLSERAFNQFHPVPVVWFGVDKTGVTFELENGRRETVRANEVLCMAFGSVRSREVVETTSGDLFGGGALRRQETLRVRRDTRIDIHLAQVALIFRLSQGRLAFDRLFPDRPMGSDLLMQEVFRQMHRAFPMATVWDEFGRAGDVLGQSWQIAAQSAEFRYAGLASVGSHLDSRRVVSESDEETFDLYSMLTRMQLIHA
ncbi:MAG: hypothetical protein KF858_13975 [Candidatus Sumerlaeia bacterium]|nr:hypothetical protein [Candidatus Sumerlaeia bacterium]